MEVESFADATKSAIQIADLNDYKIDIYHTIHFPYLLFFNRELNAYEL